MNFLRLLSLFKLLDELMLVDDFPEADLKLALTPLFLDWAPL